VVKTTYHILQSGTLMSRFFYIHAEIIQGELEKTTGRVHGFEINGIWLDHPATFVRLSGGPGQHVRLYTDLQACSEPETLLLRETKSGTVRFNSPSQTVTVHENKHRYLLLTDQTGILQSLPLLVALGRQGRLTEVYYFQDHDRESPNAFGKFVKSLSYPFHRIRELEESSFSRLLRKQTVDVQLLIVCDWDKYSRLLRLSRNLGYANEDIEGYFTGEKEERVFCARCYKIQKKLAEPEMTCRHCGTSLSVSKHYSPRIEAYLGYVSL